MTNPYLNHLAVFVCAVLSLAIGALWYSPLLFFKAWQKQTGLSDEQLAKAKPLKTYSLTLLLAWIISYNLAFFLGDSKTNWQWGLTAGLLAGVGWAATMFVIISLFEQRTLRYMLINCGYIIVYFSLIGFVLGIWR
jgi:membrane protein YdbS with pleckstrin-like domain